jgi:hypothetical protein
LIAGQRQDAEVDRLALQPRHDFQEVAHGSGQLVELGDGEALALPDVIKRAASSCWRSEPEETCSLKILSHLASRSGRSWASRPAIWPAVEVRA